MPTKKQPQTPTATALDAHRNSDTLHNINKLFWDLPIDVQRGLHERITEYLESQVARGK